MRLCAETPGNPHGAHVELKCIDGSANPYLAATAFLGLALDGIARSLPLPAEVPVDPASLPEAQRAALALASTQGEALDALEASSLARRAPGAGDRRRGAGRAAVRAADLRRRRSRGRRGGLPAGVQLLMLPAFAEGLVGVPDELVAALSEPLVDHHVHGCLTGPVSRGEFEILLNEGSPDPTPAYMTQFDSQLGFAVRRWCAPLLGLEPGVPADMYWARRARLGAERWRASCSRLRAWSGGSSTPDTAPASSPARTP